MNCCHTPVNRDHSRTYTGWPVVGSPPTIPERFVPWDWCSRLLPPGVVPTSSQYSSTALPALFPPIAHDERLLIDGAVTHTVPLWHALSGPVDRIYVCNVSGALIERRMRSPLDVAVRAFAISRNQRFDLELRHAPPEVDVVVLPNPSDQRDLFDFSDSMMLIEEAHHLAARALDEHEAEPARPRERARRRWFRRRRDVA